MTDTITATELRFERTLPAPVETVWKYLTETELRQRWFMGGALDGRVGGAIEFVFDHDQLSDDDVPMPERYAANRGRRWSETIVRYDPPHAIAYTFGSDASSIATFELKDAGDGKTLLTLVHSGIKNADQAANFGGGWASHLAVLEARLEGRGVPDFWAIHKASEDRAKAALGVEA
ncbi:MAG: SRPBCC family protein [Sphingomonas sp.]|uniref:SRPBCC family protein n=1 Tax=Sphingomonas sp. TaxID=28214 RepID=UPI003F7D554F